MLLQVIDHRSCEEEDQLLRNDRITLSHTNYKRCGGGWM